MANELTWVGAIKQYFKLADTRADMEYKEIKLQELQALPPTDRAELGQLCADALGLKLGEPIPA
jgi:hypothetical protein